jgi:hypothetical protein
MIYLAPFLKPRLFGQLLLAVMLACFPMVQTWAISSTSASPALPVRPVEENEQPEENNSSNSEVKSEHEEASYNRGERRALLSGVRYRAVPHSRGQSLILQPTRALFRSTDDDPFRNGLGCPFRC